MLDSDKIHVLRGGVVNACLESWWQTFFGHFLDFQRVKTLARVVCGKKSAPEYLDDRGWGGRKLFGQCPTMQSAFYVRDCLLHPAFIFVHLEPVFLLLHFVITPLSNNLHLLIFNNSPITTPTAFVLTHCCIWNL